VLASVGRQCDRLNDVGIRPTQCHQWVIVYG
jgi:hypothetical protein